MPDSETGSHKTPKTTVSLSLTGSDIGDYLGLAASGDRVIVLWTQQGRPDTDIFGRTLEPEPVAIEPVQFSAETVRDGIELQWTVSVTHAFSRFTLKRSDGCVASHNEVWAEGASPGKTIYTVADRNVIAGTKYCYRLEALSRTGAENWMGDLEVEAAATGRPLTIKAISPNPYKGRFHFTVTTSGAADLCTIRVFDVTGRDVSTLWSQALPVGERSFSWDGSDTHGQVTPSGIYFIEVDKGGNRAVIRITRLPDE